MTNQTSRKHPLAKCEDCPLAKKDAALTSGPADAKVAIVSRSPGLFDIQAKKPFGGPSGVILDHLLDMYGYKRDEVLVTNTVLCDTDNPPVKAIECCKPRLDDELSRADTIIAAGTEAARVIAGFGNISSQRGFVNDRVVNNNGRIKLQRVIVTNNPAVVYKESDNFPHLVADFKLALDPPPDLVYPNVRVCDTRKSVLSAIKQLSNGYLVSADLEGHRPHIECLGFAIEPRTSFVVTRKGYERSIEELKVFFENEHLNFLWHNGIYDVKLLKDNSIGGDVSEDTFALSYLLDERPVTHSLDYLARTHLGWPNYQPKSVEDYKKTGVLPENMDEFYEYNGKDVSATLQLYDKLYPLAEEEGQIPLYQRQYIPFFNTLTNIERRGFRYSINKAADLNEEVILPKMRELTKELRKLSGLEFYNPRSAPQTKGIVYERWGLKHKLRSTAKKKKDGFDKDVRKAVREGNFTCQPRMKNKMIDFATVMDTYQTINTQRGTFIEGLIKRVKSDGRLYCEFNPCGTLTGRISSRDPNFQNITRQARDVVPGIRTLFLPSEGNVIVSADYSQAELRCIAVISDCKPLLEIYNNTKLSLHHETAKRYYGHSNYDKDQYTTCKNMNFGICYLQGAMTFAQTYGLTRADAQAYIDLWWTTFPETEHWVQHVREVMESETEVRNPFNRKRRFHLITSENVDDCHRQAVNMIPQSTASEFTMNACIELDRAGVPIVSTVHDSIIADVPKDEAMEVARLMKKVMETQPKECLGWDLPFLVDISIGDTWGDAEEIEL